MPATSLNQILLGMRLRRDPAALASLGSARLQRAPERDTLTGVTGGGSQGAPAARALPSHALAGRLSTQRRFGFKSAQSARTIDFDPRQHAVVKIHYFAHAGGGGAALAAHLRYVAREAAMRAEPGGEHDALPDPGARDAEALTPPVELARKLPAERGPFYDGQIDGVDGAAYAIQWGKSDRRHFRIILAPESAAQIGDLAAYTRETMACAELALGSNLEWVAVNHWDTDNPHTHIILRGKTREGRDLIIPREFVSHGFRNVAREVATERLGNRTRDDERRALDRETRAHRPTRLDTMIARQLSPGGTVRMADLAAADGDPALTSALKARAQELQRLGLVTQTRRKVLTFASDWRHRLNAMEMHLDIRKLLVNERQVQRNPAAHKRTIQPLLHR